MVGTRRSARNGGAKGNSSSPNSSQNKPSPSAGSKRKADTATATTSKSKRGKNGTGKEQTTIEASMPSEEVQDESKDVEMKDEVDAKPAEVSNGSKEKTEVDVVAEREDEIRDQEPMQEDKKEEPPAKKKENATNGDTQDEDASADGKKEPEKNGLDTIMGNAAGAGKGDEKNITEEGTGSKVSTTDSAVEESSTREAATPSSILEKGIIYFFFRGRVGINEPSDVSDIARSYIILRPIPHGAKLAEGPIGDTKNVRMLSLPKKVLPTSPKDRFMVFVEKADASMDDVKNQLSSSDYATKTAGARHTPSAAPIGEGVYAITKTGRETHLAYILTLPSELSEVQQEVGLRQRGSYITSAKNPKSASPANASLPQGPEYPQEIIDEFHGRGWMPLEPKLLHYENTQFLIIGHGDGALEKAAKPQDGEDQNPDKETPLEEIEKLEHEDEIRDDSVFADLGLSANEYPKLQTTW
ncbi:hypothetical protein P7C71_g5284, partial [Lecanoromycetidae sp. Uapishka_2]